MKCETVLRLLDDYIAGRLGNSHQLSVSRHLNSCYNCSLNLLLIQRRRLKVTSTEDGKTVRFEYESIVERK